LNVGATSTVSVGIRVTPRFFIECELVNANAQTRVVRSRAAVEFIVICQKNVIYDDVVALINSNCNLTNYYLKVSIKICLFLKYDYFLVN